MIKGAEELVTIVGCANEVGISRSPSAEEKAPPDSSVAIFALVAML